MHLSSSPFPIPGPNGQSAQPCSGINQPLITKLMVMVLGYEPFLHEWLFLLKRGFLNASTLTRMKPMERMKDRTLPWSSRKHPFLCIPAVSLLIGPTPHSSMFSRKNSNGNNSCLLIILQTTLTDVISFWQSPSEIIWANIIMPTSHMSKLSL